MLFIYCYYFSILYYSCRHTLFIYTAIHTIYYYTYGILIRLSDV